MWFRASELKHGRVAMLATVGYLTGAAGITFPGEIAKGVSFASCNANGVFNAWSSVPEEGKLQVTRGPPAARSACSSATVLLRLATPFTRAHIVRLPRPSRVWPRIGGSDHVDMRVADGLRVPRPRRSSA